MSETTPNGRVPGRATAGKQQTPVSISLELSASGTLDEVATLAVARLALCLSETGTVTADDILDIAASITRELEG